MALLPLLGTIGRIAGAAGGGASNQRLTENQQRLQAAEMANRDALGRGQLQSSHALNSAGMDLQRRNYALNEPSTQASQAVRGSMLQRLQPLRMSGLSSRVQQSMPKLTSLLDALGPEARQAGALLAQRGVSGLEQGPAQFSPIAALNLPPMQVAELKKSGLLEKILGGLGLGGSLLGALGDLGQNNTSGNNLPIDPYGGG